MSGRRGVAEYYPRRAVKDGHARMSPDVHRTIPILVSRDFRTLIQVSLRGAGGARTHDRRIMSSPAHCPRSSTCMNIAEDAVTAPAALDSTDGPVHVPVHASHNDRFPPATERHRQAQGERPLKLSARWPSWRLTSVPPMAAYVVPQHANQMTHHQAGRSRGGSFVFQATELPRHEQARRRAVG